MNDPDSHSPTAKRRRVFGRRRASSDRSDSVRITHDDTHAWWAERETLDHLVAPKPRGARARRVEDLAAEDDTDAHTDTGSSAPRSRQPGPSEANRSAGAGPAGAGTSWRPEDVFAWADAEPAVTDSAPTPWEVLGLTSSASWPEVNRRHKLLAKQHHPDRVASASLDARADAAERMADINAAFSELRRIYRLTDTL